MSKQVRRPSEDEEQEGEEDKTAAEVLADEFVTRLKKTFRIKKPAE